MGGRPWCSIEQPSIPRQAASLSIRGRIGAAAISDVIDQDDGTILHVLSEAAVAAGLTPLSQAHGRIDWNRRFDHMQQHTGQHVLSAAFDRVLGVRTVSFHLGADSSTIDLAREVSASEIERAEEEANRIVWARSLRHDQVRRCRRSSTPAAPQGVSP